MEHENLLKNNNTLNTLYIYTDRSGIENHVGAAAYSPTISAVAHHHLGKADDTNVYAAELTAIHLGIKMAGKSPEQYDICYIFVDNQQSIQAIDKPKQQSGQCIISNILESLDELQAQRPNLEFRIECRSRAISLCPQIRPNTYNGPSLQPGRASKIDLNVSMKM
jgi:hypothetical protein